MNTSSTILCVIGTRPEAIKLAPVVRALGETTWARCRVVATAQHRDLLDQMLGRLRVPVHYDLDLMQPGQSPSDLLARMLPALSQVYSSESPDAVLAQGDTTTVLGAALTAFHHRINFGHVEAGLRTHDLAQPFPEEGYRQMVSRISRWHFAPTAGARSALQAEGIDPERIHVTGNTCIDTLMQTLRDLPSPVLQAQRTVLLTAHRRENFGAPLRSIFAGALRLVERFPDVRLVCPVHPNPEVRSAAQSLLGGHPRIELLPPQDYFDFVKLMRQATLILTDSGGVQEEAPALGIPVLVLRDSTERPEALSAGLSRLVGTNALEIEAAAAELLSDPAAYRAMAGTGISPYGDGEAAHRIVSVLRTTLEASP